MANYTKVKFMTELATQVTVSKAHNSDSHPSHRLAVCLAHVLWNLSSDHPNFDEFDIKCIVSSLNKKF